MGPNRLRNALVIAQVMVCAMLLMTGGVLLRGAQRLQSLELGLHGSDVVDLYVPRVLHERVVERLRAHPAVVAIEAAADAPLDGRFQQVSAASASATGIIASRNRVTPGYFAALGIGLVRGRTFSADEARTQSDVVIVSESAARALWPRGDAIGATVRLTTAYVGRPIEPRTAHVIGIVRDHVTGIMIERRDHPAIYAPNAVELANGPLIVSTRGGGVGMRDSLRTWLAGVDPGGSVEIHTLDESVELQLYPFRAAHWIASTVGGIALLLTVSGIYGVLAYLVAMRQKEIGIRVALGATRRTIVTLVVRQSVRLAAIGTVAGAALALGASRLMSTQLSMIPAFDAMAVGTGAAVVLLAALGAAYVPSKRAAGVDVLESLRQ